MFEPQELKDVEDHITKKKEWENERNLIQSHVLHHLI